MIACKHLLLILLMISILACNSNSVKEVYDEDSGALLERYEVKKDNLKRHGFYERYSEGNLVETATYYEDTLHGVRTIFTPGGQTLIEEEYKMGMYDGVYKKYYESGELMLEGPYIDNKMEGKWTKYYASGQIMEVVEMHDNSENGPFIEYYEDGTLKAEGTYLDGDNEDGLLVLYKEDGSVDRKMQCEKGICHTISDTE